MLLKDVVVKAKELASYIGEKVYYIYNEDEENEYSIKTAILVGLCIKDDSRTEKYIEEDDIMGYEQHYLSTFIIEEEFFEINSISYYNILEERTLYINHEDAQSALYEQLCRSVEEKQKSIDKEKKELEKIKVKLLNKE